MAGLRWDSGNYGSLVHMPLAHPTLISNHKDQVFGLILQPLTFTILHAILYTSRHSIFIEMTCYVSLKNVTHILMGSVHMTEVL